MLKAMTDSLYILQKGSDSNDILAILSLMIALLAVIVGPMVQLRISKKQIMLQVVEIEKKTRIAVLSNNRQAWINQLRDELTKFLSCAYDLYFQFMAEEEFEKGREKMITLSLYWYKIKLLINPKELDHQALISKIDELHLAIIRNERKEGKDFESDLAQLFNEIVSLGQSIFKREWERVKSLE